MSLLEDLSWRYATKKYDPSKKVSTEDVHKIIEAARLAPTSSGLQQFRVLLITNQELKEKIVPVAMDQQIIADCSHLLVFAAWDQYTEERIDEIYNRTTDERELPRGRFSSYTDRLKSLYLQQSAEENFVHTARQAYIGFGLAIAQAAELKIDTTPVEGFNNQQLDELLGLTEKGLKSVTLLPIGYRDNEGDWLVNMKKVRNPQSEFVIEYN
ncbi:NAD(P)H-dependent oxidoreductase [Sphingobacterium spiritivorum]|uniref:Major NAD(P)H-flavin oxidoreductase n=2 Tax=Sphingobacterium spiritivorum TaxID=258 RepID=A0A380CT53_SPHSI|nr:NAD(P)H-dependent oxidoreductase [Sphingobacterium spiritivorum]EEI93543.1 nitroreductase family protein [Sphingobacterium spiritivorum ATCC 33300]QQS95789.1 NAD(P)H-dependent oxidoreductase [Sphingobacterium spiritivorum]SUJ28323.1 Major NAD(P)H-flavin oxidoreductase [Sphingobacterium spiritivorum]